MNRVQRIVFSMLMTYLAAILVLQHLLSDNFRIMGIVLYALIASIFVGSRFAPAPTKTHRTLARAIMFIVIGDFFLILLGTFPCISKGDLFVKVGGMIGFLCAYGTLITLYIRNFSFGKKDFLASLPVLAVLGPVLGVLLPLVPPGMKVFSVVFGLTVGFMAWNALCQIHRAYFTGTVAIRTAVSGFLMFLSDMGVAFVFFYPGMEQNSPWLENEIWITYVPAWSLVFVNLLEEKLLAGE